MADQHTALARLWGAVRRERRRRDAEGLAALEMPVTDVVASQAVFEVVDRHLQDAADAGRAPTNRELLAHAHAAGEVGRAVDRLAMAYDRAAAGQGGAR